MATKTKIQTVDDYMENFPANVQQILQAIRITIQKTKPGMEEAISYQIPTFKLNGKYVVYFAGWKNHVSLYPIPKGNSAFTKQIALYKTGKGTVQFPIDRPIPLRLVSQITKNRIKDVLKKEKEKKKSK